MATRYSNLYGEIPVTSTSSGAITTTSSYSYKGPLGNASGEAVSVYATYANTANSLAVGSSDTLKICKLPPRAKVIRIGILASTDMDTDNDFTFNLGTSASATAYASASTGLQATSAVELDFSDNISDAAIGADGDELILAVAAGELEVAGTIHFNVEYVIP